MAGTTSAGPRATRLRPLPARIPEAMYDEIVALAGREHRSLSAQVLWLLEKALGRHAQNEEENAA